MAESDRVDDILRVKDEDTLIRPQRCPRCGQKVIFEDDGRIVCEDDGELYYDHWLGIWRVLPVDVHED